MSDFRSKPCNSGDYQYWVERNRGRTQAFRQPLKGDKIDSNLPREHIDKVALPDPDLVTQYEVLQSGGMPATA